MFALQAIVTPLVKSQLELWLSSDELLIAPPPKEEGLKEAKLGCFTYVLRHFDFSNLKVTSAPTNIPSHLTYKEIHAYVSKTKEPVIGKAWVYMKAVDKGTGNLQSLLSIDAHKACYNYYHAGKEERKDEKTLPNLQLGDAIEQAGFFASLPSEIQHKILFFVTDIELQQKTYLCCQHTKTDANGWCRANYSRALGNAGIGIPKSLLSLRLVCRYFDNEAIVYMMRQFAFSFSRPAMLDNFLSVFSPKFVLLKQQRRTFQTIVIDARMNQFAWPLKTSFVSLDRIHGIGALSKILDAAAWDRSLKRAQYYSRLLPCSATDSLNMYTKKAIVMNGIEQPVPLTEFRGLRSKNGLTNWAGPLGNLSGKFSVDKLVIRYDMEDCLGTTSSPNSVTRRASSLLAGRDLTTTITVFRQVGGWDNRDNSSQE